MKCGSKFRRGALCGQAVTRALKITLDTTFLVSSLESSSPPLDFPSTGGAKPNVRAEH